MSITVTGGEQFAKLSADFRAAGTAGRGLRNKLGRNVRGVLRPVVAESQAKARAIPAKGPKSTGLRGQLAAATRMRVRLAGASPMVRLEVARSKMPAGKENLPALMDGWSAWRKPLFGDKSSWHPQEAHRFFLVVVNRHLPAVRISVVAAADQTAVEIERGL